MSSPRAEEIWTVHVEVRLKPTSSLSFDSIREAASQYIQSLHAIVLPSVHSSWTHHALLEKNIDRMSFAESACPHSCIQTAHSDFEIHVYQPSVDNATDDFVTGEGEEGVKSASVTELPCIQWDGLWDSLIYPDDIKGRLLDYIYSTFLLSDADVDFNIICWNRVVLLHGPPGTGKTSLCRALAQKLAIRLSRRYPQSRILEINSHSLFSRWFSESGKLVQRLFEGVNELIDDESHFVVILIDEVESLTAARASAVAGNEPSDALRVVNALLTQLDKLKHRKNVLVMTTSNLPKAIDDAFVDRADIVQFIGLPPQEALYSILRSCMQELMSKGILEEVPISIAKQALANFRSFQSQNALPNGHIPSSHQDHSMYLDSVTFRLWRASGKCEGMSGRMLRRLPVLAQARCLRLGQSREKVCGTSSSAAAKQSSLQLVRKQSVHAWLDALESVIDVEVQNRISL